MGAMKNYTFIVSAVLFTIACVNADVCHFELPGELNGDCKADIADFALLSQAWLADANEVSLELLAQVWLIDCKNNPVAPECIPLDIDGDGFDAIADCNDHDPTIYPGAIEIPGDGIDQDCDPFDGSTDLVWVYIDDPGVPTHEPFNGYMSKYETTNAQYCQFLNDALATGDIIVDSNDVIGVSDPYSGEYYYYLAGPGTDNNGAANGGAARINWTGSSFTVDSGFDNHPVTFVTWYGSTAFASYYGWRLPTEWEWQAVADNTEADPYIYGCGPTINNSIANYRNSTHPEGTSAVGSFGTYGYGMCDMAGNLWERTSSAYGDGYNIIRGSCWIRSDYTCPVSNWIKVLPDSPNSTIGFRVCR